MDKCREEFEAWYERYCTDNGLNCSLLIMPTGSYLNTLSELCFTGWEASRENMNAIKLPDLNAMCISTTAKNKIISAITSAGYKVEE